MKDYRPFGDLNIGDVIYTIDKATLKLKSLHISEIEGKGNSHKYITFQAINMQALEKKNMDILTANTTLPTLTLVFPKDTWLVITPQADVYASDLKKIKGWMGNTN